MKFYVRRGTISSKVAIDPNGEWRKVDSTEYRSAARLAFPEIVEKLGSLDSDRFYWRYCRDREVNQYPTTLTTDCLVGCIAESFKIYSDGYVEWYHDPAEG